jgi:DNA mismatch endonuclease (patch repair protein)
MADVFTKAKRSEVMSRIRGSGNKDTELKLAELLRSERITGWRRQVEIRGRARSPLRAAGGASVHASRLASSLAPPKTGAHGVPRSTFRVKPDFVFTKLKLAIFVDGCFCHGCPKHATKPKNNRAFWQKKLAGNIKRDALVTRTLRRTGWRVLRVWEHTLRWATKDPKCEARLLRRIQRALGG